MTAESSWADALEAVPGVAKPDPIVVATGVQRTFGGLHAVDVDHLEIQRGAITSLIGPNGAGETTLFNLLTGFDKADAGTFSLDREPIVGIPSYQVARKGLVRTFQLTKSLSRLTVLENVMAAAPHHRGERLINAVFGGWKGREQQVEVQARELVSRFGMEHMVDQYAGTLSGGQRKLLEMARALMVDPAVVMLDEPMAGVNPALTQSLLEHITGLRDNDGRTVVFVEHDMDVVQEISDWVVVLGEGRVIAEGPPKVVAKNEAVIAAYLGGAA